MDNSAPAAEIKFGPAIPQSVVMLCETCSCELTVSISRLLSYPWVTPQKFLWVCPQCVSMQAAQVVGIQNDAQEGLVGILPGDA